MSFPRFSYFSFPTPLYRPAFPVIYRCLGVRSLRNYERRTGWSALSRKWFIRESRATSIVGRWPAIEPPRSQTFNIHRAIAFYFRPPPPSPPRRSSREETANFRGRRDATVTATRSVQPVSRRSLNNSARRSTERKRRGKGKEEIRVDKKRVRVVKPREGKKGRKERVEQ